MQEYKATKDTSLIELLTQMYPQKSKSGIKQLLRNGCVKYKSAVVTKATTIVAAGQSISVSKAGFIPSGAEEIPDIVFEDEHMILINKPTGLLSMSTPGERENTAYFMLSNYVKKSNRQNKIFIVHRLDRDTSGLILFAKSEEIRNQLQKSWHNSMHFREYYALVSGCVSPTQGTVESYLKENSNLQVFSAEDDEEGGLHAITHYRTLEQTPFYTLLSVTPETGRRNQIRVHLADLGFPIVGDKRYGNGDSPIHRLGLHASKLSFMHPVTGRKMEFHTPIPRSFQRLMKYEG